jgi:hypothetical protein
MRLPLSTSRAHGKGAKKKSSGGGRPRPGKKRGPETPYFMQPAPGGGIGVYRRPVGNRAEPTTCGIMASKKQADLLVAQLKRAESVVSDLFLEATDDGIEALEAVLAACRAAVMKQAERAERSQRPPKGGRLARPTGEAGGDAGDRPSPGGGAGRRRRGRGRGRPRGGPADGSPGDAGGAPAGEGR